MKTKHLLIISSLTLAEGIIALILMWGMPVDSSRGHLINYASLRLIVGGLFSAILLAVLVSIIALWLKTGWGQRISSLLDRQLVGPKKRLFFVQGALIVLSVFLAECFFMTFLAFPVPMRPIFAWLFLTCFQVWLVFRLVYDSSYRERPSFFTVVKLKWNAWLPMQRKSFKILAILGLVYFLAFIPNNWLHQSKGKFYVHQDEHILFIDVAKALTTQDSLSATIHNSLGSWTWQYGFPYLTVSAAVVFIPRLIFGNQFSDQIQLNIFLLRQFISVLPMILAMLLATYLVTRFRSLRMSVGMFVFLALVPGIVKINNNFWHPDALVILLILLIIFALVKDELRFGRFFYYAAIFCGVCSIIKLFGLFFGPVIAGYLLVGLFKKRLTFGKFLGSAALFLFTMLAAIIISSPTLMDFQIFKQVVHSWGPFQPSLLNGYSADTSGLYDTGLMNWLKYFGAHFMKGYFFFFTFFALIVGSLWGARVYLNRIILGWCAVTSIFLAYFVALKNFQYMLPVAVPLFCAAFLFPAVTETNTDSKVGAFLARPLTRKIVWTITILMLASQLIINLVILTLYAIRGR
jgi:hypothetical protein